MSLPGRPLPSEDETTFRRRNNLEGLKDFWLKAKARFWPWLSDICHTGVPRSW
jgi:hypothetical protein